jgi:DNA polymerase III alpha subunit
MFITIQDETGGWGSDLILWPDRFEQQRRLVLSAGMIACHGLMQRAGEVVHVVVSKLEDLSDLLRSVCVHSASIRSSPAWKLPKSYGQNRLICRRQMTAQASVVGARCRSARRS